MNLIFMRHGEATDNVREIISDKEIYWSTLTEDGKKVVNETVDSITQQVDKIYVSPLPRTIQTAHIVCEKLSNVEVVVDNRLREIGNGKYSGKQNNSELDAVREKQVSGDFFVRFGEYGENKFDIEYRLSMFLKDVYEQNFKNNTIMIVSHGSITSFMKRILDIKTAHIKTGKAEIFENVDFTKLYKHIKKLNRVRKDKTNARIEIVKKLKLSNTTKNSLIKLCKDEFNNMELSDDVFDKYTEGVNLENLNICKKSKFDEGIILVCIYNNFENFAKKWMQHYIDLGVTNFVMINNNSSDNSQKLVELFDGCVNIDYWFTNEKYDCYKMCGCKQKIMDYYGVNKNYLIVDSDELFVYEGYKQIKIQDYLQKQKSNYVKSVMLDVYSKIGIGDLILDNYIYTDFNTYKKTENIYGVRVYGGFRNRIFGIRPSLQKVPIIRYTGKEIYLNDHFYYPWKINKIATNNTFLLHYKFLSGDVEKYREFAEDGRHWNNSKEYKTYINVLDNKGISTFYNVDNAIRVEEIFEKIKF